MFSDLLRWGTRASRPRPLRRSRRLPKGVETVITSKGLPKFLSALSGQPSPAAVIDFGPVIGSNVAYLGERLGCKLFIEDLTSELSRHLKAGTMEALPEAVQLRLQPRRGERRRDPVLGLFRFPEKTGGAEASQDTWWTCCAPAARSWATSRISDVERSNFMKYEIVDDQSMRHRQHVGSGARHAHPNREIIRMFEGLTVAESFLLKNNSREILLRKKH